MIFTISLLISYDEWLLSSPIPREEVINSMPVVEELARSILAYIPRKQFYGHENENNGTVGGDLETSTTIKTEKVQEVGAQSPQRKKHRSTKHRKKKGAKKSAAEIQELLSNVKSILFS